jgi:uncharacterized protein YifE (UPF0438 family)
MMIKINSWDQRLLKEHLYCYMDLHQGKRIPSSPAEKHFVNVLQQHYWPRTQHEIAYARFLSAPKRVRLTIKMKAQVYRQTARVREKAWQFKKSIQPDTVNGIVNDIDEALVETTPGSWSDQLLQMYRNLYFAGAAGAGSMKDDAALWLTTALSTPDFAKTLSKWAGEQFNTLSNEVTKGMDGSFAEGLVSGKEYVSPGTHRLFGGHTLTEAINKAREVLPEGTPETEVIWEALRALASDLSSYSGLPITTFTQKGFSKIESLAAYVGLDKAQLTDLLTFNAVEVLATAVPVLALLLGWNTKDREEFWTSLGVFGFSAVVSANPLLLLTVLVASALDFQRNREGQINTKEMAMSFVRGGALSGIVMLSSLAIGGPVFVGIICGIILAVMAKEHGSELIARMFIVIIDYLPNAQRMGSNIKKLPTL